MYSFFLLSRGLKVFFPFIKEGGSHLSTCVVFRIVPAYVVVLLSFQMKIYMNIYEDNTSLKLQVWLKYLLSTFFFFFNTDMYAFSMCSFFPCISASFVFFVFFSFLFYHLWIAKCPFMALCHVLSLDWRWYLMCIFAANLICSAHLFKLLHLFVWFCHNWSVPFNNVHMKETHIFETLEFETNQQKWTEVRVCFYFLWCCFCLPPVSGAAVHVLLFCFLTVKNAFILKNKVIFI